MEILHIVTSNFGGVSVELPGWIVAIYACIFLLGIVAAAIGNK